MMIGDYYVSMGIIVFGSPIVIGVVGSILVTLLGKWKW